jgi:hypothetical protein
MIKKCKHGTYDPHGDARYCTVCNPIKLENVVVEKSHNISLVAVPKMTEEEEEKKDKLEKRLVRAGLGVYQPMTDNSDGELAEDTSVSLKAGVSQDHAKLRGSIDGGDQFMDAFQVTKVRKIEREIPEWVYSMTEIQRVLITAFPRLATLSKELLFKDKNAARWGQIINLYYRMNQPRQIVARELGMTEVDLKRMLLSITRAEKGLRTDGKARVVTPRTPNVVLEKKGDETK